MNRILILLLLLTMISLNKLSAKTAIGCNAEFTYSVVEEISPLTIEFIDVSVCSSSIQTWRWTFGDGESSTKQNPSHQYFEEGNYIVTLEIISEDGYSSYIKDTVTLNKRDEENCTAYFTYMINTSATTYTYSFSDHSISTNSTIINWFWDFGDDSPILSQQNPSHHFLDTGYYDITLVSVSIDSCYSYHTERIHVGDYALDCNASFTHNHNNNTNISFTDISTIYDSITSWQWFFGDGNYSNTQNPVHDYPYSGVYDVTLIITTNNCTDSVTIPIVVGDPNNYSVWGRVYVGNLTTDKCQAYLFRKYQQGFVLPFDTVNLTSVNDTLGIYYFYQIPEGEYYIQLRLPSTSGYSTDFCPTYYGDSPFWAQSQVMQVFSDMSNMHINMQAITHETGNNYISGSVSNNATGIIENVLTLLYNENNDVVDYTYSDSFGNYEFENVSSGTYCVYGELAGFTSIPAVTPTLNNYDSTINVNFIIENTTATGYILSEEESSNNNYKIYPNPIVNNKFFIKFDKNIINTCTYSILNAIGVEEESGLLDAYEKGFNINLENDLPMGVYLISVRSIDRQFLGTKKVIIN